jgi:hypothetical protein
MISNGSAETQTRISLNFRTSLTVGPSKGSSIGDLVVAVVILRADMAEEAAFTRKVGKNDILFLT